MSPLLGLGGVCFLFCVCLVVRLVALDADPPAWLSWSMALQTDEGFYTLDARHEVLFSSWASGNFHDRLLSPLLSVLQQCVFSVFGVGMLPVRLLSVAFGMLTLAAFWYGLRLAYGDNVAFWGALLLGLAPPVAFYNRLALQETPTVFWLVLAYVLAVKGRNSGVGRRQITYVVLSGFCAALAVMFKALALLALPAFLIAWRGISLPKLGWGIMGFAAVLGLYDLLWTTPNHAELARMSQFYWHRQFEPHSWRSLSWNLRRGLINPERGLLPYLLMFLPVPCLLMIGGLRRGGSTARLPLAFWLLGGVLFCLLSSYAPDRYYLLFYPALAGLAALAAARLTRPQQGVVLGVFLLSSGFWYARAWEGRTFARRDASRLLAQTLPAGSILVGEMAPTLALDTPFAAAPVQPGLSNDDRPVERLRANYALVTRTPGSLQWWRVNEPAVVQPSGKVMTLALGGRWHTIVDVYAIGKQGH